MGRGWLSVSVLYWHVVGCRYVVVKRLQVFKLFGEFPSVFRPDRFLSAAGGSFLALRLLQFVFKCMNAPAEIAFSLENRKRLVCGALMEKIRAVQIGRAHV